MEDQRNIINQGLCDGESYHQNATVRSYGEGNYSFSNMHNTGRTADHSVPSNIYSELYNQTDNAFANSNTLNDGENQAGSSNECNPVESTETPQGLWRKRRDANLKANLDSRNSPSRFTPLYKSRMPFSPSPAKIRGIKPDGRTSWLNNARKIRMQTSDSGQKLHLRSLSHCNARNRNDEFAGSSEVLQRPRRSLDSATGMASFQPQANVCSSPQNFELSCSSPQSSYPSPYIAATPDQSPPAAWNRTYFQVKPQFETYQLVGDSLLLRFAEQLLDIHSGTVEGSRGIGLCVSGQKSGDLLRRVCQQIYPVSKKIVLLIGTNDLLQNVPEVEVCATLKKLIKTLKLSASRIVLLTLPPIPKMQLRLEHWIKIEFINNFIRSMQDDVISVADIHTLYVTEPRSCKMEFFERYYGDGQRIDLIHLNRSGLEEIRNFLLQNNFLN